MTSPLLDTLRAALGREYAIERELGGGGMARVFVGIDRALGRQVVLKVLAPESVGSLSADRFKREVQLAARLQHPHIVPLLSAGEVDGMLYYTMPYIEGESLRARLERERELPVGAAVKILRDVADALAYAHGQGIIHRDIKPENILFSAEHAVVTDFGIAKALVTSQLTPDDASGASGLTQVGVAIGTPAYMAPEQASADPQVDQRADIYALGAVGYELLTGRPPFSGTTLQSVLAAVISAEPAQITVQRKTVPAPLAELLMNCLAKHPADRPQSARELLAALESIGTRSGVTGGARRSMMHGRRSIMVGSAAGVTLAGALFAFVLRPREGVLQAAETIAVMPFLPATDDSALTRLGRDLVVTLSSNLDGVGPIRAIDPGSILGFTRDRAAVTLNDARAVAERTGARSHVTGTLIRTGQRVRLDLALHETSDLTGDPLARVSVQAHPDSVSALSDSAAWGLLRQIWRSDAPPTPSVAALTTTSFPALRAYLEGERFRADGRWPEAITAFDRAIEADSSFWVAYWRAADSRGWMLERSIPAVYRRYLDHLDEFSERDRLFILARRTRRLSDRLDAYRELLRRYPDYWAAWVRLGDDILHLGPTIGIPVADAVEPFNRALRLQPRATEVWQHLLWIEAARGALRDSTASAVMDTLVALGYDTASARTWGFDELLFYRGARALSDDRLRDVMVDSIARAIARTTAGPDISWSIAASSLTAGITANDQLAISERLSQLDAPSLLVAGNRWAARLAWGMRGRWDSVVAMHARETSTLLPALDAVRFAAFAERIGASPTGHFDRAIARLRPRWAGLSDAERAEVVWLEGVVAQSRGEVPTLASKVEQLRAMASSVPASEGPGPTQQFAELLDAFDRQARGDGGAMKDAIRIEREMSDLGRYGSQNVIVWLEGSRALQTQGRYDDAAVLLGGVAALITDQGATGMFLAARPLFELEMARVESARGNVTEALRHYERFLRDYDSPVPAHEPLVQEARDAVARLSRRTG